MLRRWQLYRQAHDAWLLRSLALVISLMLWFSLLGGKKSVVEKDAELRFDLPPGWVLSQTSARKVKFTVSGSGPFLRDLEKKVFVLPVPIKDPVEGPFELKVTKDVLRSQLGFQTQSVSPETITIKVEPLMKRVVSVRPVIADRLPREVEIERISVNPAFFEISGPRSRVERLDTIPTRPITLSLSQSQQQHRAALILEEGVAIEAGEQQVAQVDVEVWLKGSTSKRWVRRVPVTLKWGDLDAEGRKVFKNSEITPTPNEIDILVEGPSSLLKRLKPTDIRMWSLVEGEVVNKKKLPLGWTLPPDIFLIRGSSQNIELNVSTR
jgi:YbbR domain-containing protein